MQRNLAILIYFSRLARAIDGIISGLESFSLIRVTGKLNGASGNLGGPAGKKHIEHTARKAVSPRQRK
jgi:hypothetical protein